MEHFSFYLATDFFFNVQIPGFLVFYLFLLSAENMLNIFWNTIQYAYDV